MKDLVSLSLVLGFVSCAGLLACGSSSDGGGSAGGSAGAGAGGGTAGGVVAPGDPCIKTSDCAAQAGEEMACQCTPESATTICVALKSAGESCGSGQNFEIGCRSSAPCVYSPDGSKCTATAEKGESCNGRMCSAGLACNTDTFTCEEAHAIGQPCVHTDPKPCVDGAYCSFDSGSCEALIPTGGACSHSSTDACVDGSTCSWTSNKCVAILAAGSPCEENDQCATLFCSADYETGVKKCIDEQSSPSQCGF